MTSKALEGFLALFSCLSWRPVGLMAETDSSRWVGGGVDRIVAYRREALGHWRSTSNRQGETGRMSPGSVGLHGVRIWSAYFSILDCLLAKSWAPFPLIPGSSLMLPPHQHEQCSLSVWELLVWEHSVPAGYRCLWAFERTSQVQSTCRPGGSVRRLRDFDGGDHGAM